MPNKLDLDILFDWVAIGGITIKIKQTGKNLRNYPVTLHHQQCNFACQAAPAHHLLSLFINYRVIRIACKNVSHCIQLRFQKELEKYPLMDDVHPSELAVPQAQLYRATSTRHLLFRALSSSGVPMQVQLRFLSCGEKKKARRVAWIEHRSTSASRG
jgi:hypothetical protein